MNTKPKEGQKQDTKQTCGRRRRTKKTTKAEMVQDRKQADHCRWRRRSNKSETSSKTVDKQLTEGSKRHEQKQVGAAGNKQCAAGAEKKFMSNYSAPGREKHNYISQLHYHSYSTFIFDIHV